MVIRLPARVGGRGELPTIPARTGEEVETPEANPPDYTEWVELEPVAILRRDIESPNAEPDQTWEIPRPVSTTNHEGDKESNKIDAGRNGTTVVALAPGISEQTSGRVNIDPVLQEETLQVMLDPEITETIRQMA